MTTIRLENLTKIFDRDFVAIDDISLSFEEGSTTCLLGPSGCGKTTLMRMIAGLETPSSGSIFFGGDDVTQFKTRQRDLGMVFQYPVVYRGTTIRENIALPLRREPLTKAEKANRVEEVLSLLGLDSVADLDVSRLDNATRQKVAVARAISRRPPIVLFDEPITNVDIHAKLQLKRVLKELFTKLNQTVLYVTHDQTEAMTLADNIALMKDGRIEQLASPRELYSKSESIFAGWFLGNPGMNFVHWSDSKELAETLAGFPLSDDVATIGFRPEDARIHKDAGEGGRARSVVDHVALATGGQLLVSLTSNDQKIKAKLPANVDLELSAGDETWLSVPRHLIRSFDENERLAQQPEVDDVHVRS